ncbi:DinB family protein [Deinococcus sp. KNUC1210]|uniref:DinB family protein n=1 Tax=Deinococcus sp. KNUC1210 TaxID=2917691 RepID=UPI001EEFB329|nr:DinB family protein [Deinococcus sp. KNUC1210]ULH15372.1 DinB family protein [Deinococcus sp. KNUC1210]
MPDSLLYGAPPETLRLLLGHADFAAPWQILGHLDAHLACQRLPKLGHSIAEIVGHLHNNMLYNLDLIEGRAAPERPDWPPVKEQAWPTLAADFLEVLELLLDYAQRPELLERVVFPATATEPGWTVGYKLTVNVAKHNAYHFGQIVILRQLLGAWPGVPSADQL